VFAGILVLTAFALLLDFIVTMLERWLLRWRPGAAAVETY
jgi:NitT/TauT family transport system permease protein